MEDQRTMKLPGRKSRRLVVIVLFSSIALACTPLFAQGGGGMINAPSALSQTNSAQNPFVGSVPEGKASPQVLQISFKDAIDRGLRNNLGLLLQGDTTLAARGAKWKELSALLPNVSGTVSANVARINLAAQGFRFSSPQFAGIPTVVGPFGFFDARLNFSQSVFDWSAINRERSASENEKAAQYTYKDARDLVVLAVGNAYLLALAEAARVDTAEAQVTTAQTLYDRSVNQQKAGVAPAIDVLRAQVELQSRQQDLINARANYAKQRLSLGRVIGLAPGQQFELIEKMPYEPLATATLDDDLRRAYASRSDYQAAAIRVRAAERMRRAASAEHYPTVEIGGSFGDTSVTVGSPEKTYQMGATLSIPIFAGGRTHGDVLQAEANLRDARSRLEDLRGQIDYDVRAARLDLEAASQAVEVARSTVDLAGQTLIQARDRFAAGVTDNLEVVQAQESVATANDNYISSLYSHNLAKVALARAVGIAEEGVKQYLQSKHP